MRIEWQCNFISSNGGVTKYVFFNNKNDVEINCTSVGKIKEIKEAVEITLKRMNSADSRLKTGNGIRK